MARSSRPPRFYCSNLPHPRLGEPRCALDAEQTRHARKVLRLEQGDRIELFDGAGRVAQAALAGFSGGMAWTEVRSVEQQPRSEPTVRVAAAMPKGPASDTLVNGLSQLGADCFTPLQTQRGVVDPRQNKLERLEKLALESAKQCGRNYLMGIDQSAPLGEVVRQPIDLGLVLNPDAKALPPEDLAGLLGGMQRVTLLIGPEGGFTDQELQLADNHEYVPWPMNHNTLRIETAAQAAMSVVSYLTMGRGRG